MWFLLGWRVVWRRVPDTTFKCDHSSKWADSCLLPLVERIVIIIVNNCESFNLNIYWIAWKDRPYTLTHASETVTINSTPDAGASFSCQCTTSNVIHVGPGHPSFSLFYLLPHLFPFYFFSFFHWLYLFPFLSISFRSTRIAPLRLQAGGRRKRPNLGLVCCV